jgi:hypothetical protein
VRRRKTKGEGAGCHTALQPEVRVSNLTVATATVNLLVRHEGDVGVNVLRREAVSR